MQKATFSLAEYMRPFLEVQENKFDVWAKLFIYALLYLFNQEIDAPESVTKSLPGKCGNVCSPREVNCFYTLQKRRLKAIYPVKCVKNKRINEHDS